MQSHNGETISYAKTGSERHNAFTAQSIRRSKVLETLSEKIRGPYKKRAAVTDKTRLKISCIRI